MNKEYNNFFSTNFFVDEFEFILEINFTDSYFERVFPELMPKNDQNCIHSENVNYFSKLSQIKIVKKSINNSLDHFPQQIYIYFKINNLLKLFLNVKR